MRLKYRLVVSVVGDQDPNPERVIMGGWRRVGNYRETAENDLL